MSEKKTWSIEKKPHGVNLTVTRSCGHQETLPYGSRKFAEAEVEGLEMTPCLACQNAAALSKAEVLP